MLPSVTMMFISCLHGYFGYSQFTDLPEQNGLFEQIRLWLWDSLRFINPFGVSLTYKDYLRFGPYLWTIPVEFRASLYIFVMLLALSRAANTIRLASIIGMELWLFTVGQDWDIFLFNSGLLLCEFHNRRSDKQQGEVPHQGMTLPQDEPQRRSNDQLQTQPTSQDQTDITPLWAEQSSHLPESMATTSVQAMSEKPRDSCLIHLLVLPRYLFRPLFTRRPWFLRRSFLVIGKAMIFFLILYIMSMGDDEETPSFEVSPYPLYPWIHRHVGGSVIKPVPITEILSNGTSIVNMVQPKPLFPQWYGHSNPGRLHTVLSATAFVLFVDNTPIIQKFFTLTFLQYLGEISYSMYLVQFLVWRWSGTYIYGYVAFHSLLPAIFSGLPVDSEKGQWGEAPSTLHGREICFLVVIAMLLPILFYVADLCTRFVDKPSIQLARWMEKRFFVGAVVRHS